MKNPLLTLLLVALLPTLLLAQKPKPEELTNAQHARNFIERLAPRLDITKGQKDTLTDIFTRYMDDVDRYKAGNNATIINYLMKGRDEKVEKLLRSPAKFEKYLLVMAEIQKQRTPSKEVNPSR